jgi:hypothetical protein
MTEYDYSPDAYERHMATQEKIRRWVDQTLEHSPCNPFALLPSEEYERSQTPQPAFRATPHGDISPTYSNFPRTRHEQNHLHNPSRRSSISSASLMMPQARSRPQYDRSVTSPQPQASAGQFFPQASKPGPFPYSPYPAPPSRIPSPYSPRHSSHHREQPPPMPHRSSSQNSFRHGSVHSPHIHASPVIQQQHYPYFSPSYQQQQQQHVPVVVVRADRDFTVVPPQGHHIQFYVRFF